MTARGAAAVRSGQVLVTLPSSLRPAKVSNPRGVRNHGAKSQSASIGRALIPPP
jgi:hypothetical protein